MSKTFILRKLHQITGVFPLGVFYFFHLYTNSKALKGKEVYNDAVADIHNIPYLFLVETVTIFIPLIFHSVYGLIITAETRTNIFNYNYKHNWFYIMQRITGVFLFLFLTFHILNFRFGLLPGLNLTPVAGNAEIAFDIIAAEYALPWVVIIYILGVAATAWHLAYGFFLVAIDWGIVIGEKAQKYALSLCITIFMGLFLVGVNSILAFIYPGGFSLDIFY